jgi:hypothetical protein
MKMTKKQQKAQDARINRLYCQNCSGLEINVLDISKVFREGHRLIAEGADDAALAAGLLAFTQQLARN